MGMDGCLYSEIIEVNLIYGNGWMSVQRGHVGSIYLWMDGCLYSGIMEVASINGNGWVSVQRDHGSNFNLWEWTGVSTARPLK